MPEPLEGQCGFGSAMQAVLRYLGGAAASPELAARLGSNAASTSGTAANGKPGLAGNSYAGTCPMNQICQEESGCIRIKVCLLHPIWPSLATPTRAGAPWNMLPGGLGEQNQ